jgi:TDG/mug DNA glycosylase family protein
LRRRLPDRLCSEPRILFVGINPSLRSAALGHHFAGRGNPFWRLLYAARLVPEPFTFKDDVSLPHFGLALTNIVDRPTREASEIRPDEYARGRRRLARLIARVHPRVVAFVGVTAYRQFLGRGASAGVATARAPALQSGAVGCGPTPEQSGTARVFVVPNPSGRNAAFPGFQDKLIWYRRLSSYVEQME